MSGDGETTSTQARHPYTNDFAALFLVLSSMIIIGLSAYGALDLAAVPAEVRVGLWLPGFGVAVAWLFGGGAVKAYKHMTGGGQ